MTTIEDVYAISFTLPKRSHPADTRLQHMKTSDLAQLITDVSFPAISTNVKPADVNLENKFIDCNTSASAVSRKATKSREDTFRTRNRFIIARNVLGKMVRMQQMDLNSISKVVSLIWKRNGRPLHDYFEYLSLLESYWYERFRSTNKNTSKNTPKQIFDLLEGVVPYSNMTSTSYTTSKPPRKRLNPSSPSSKGSKFRVFKSSPQRTKKAKRTDDYMNCKIQDFFYDNLGMLTPDMFFQDV